MTDHAKKASKIIDKLRERREALGLTQADIAERLDVSQRSVSSYENADAVGMELTSLLRYAEAVGVKLCLLEEGGVY